MPRPTVYGLLALLAACSSDPTDAGPLPAVALEVVSGGSQSQLAGYPLDAPVVVRAVNAEGAPVAGVEVALGEILPGASVEMSGTTTGPDGTLGATWRLAPRLGAQTLQFTMPTVAGASALNVPAQGTGAAVRAISGHTTSGMCAVYLDGRLGCWTVNRGPPLVPPTVAFADGAERYRDVSLSWYSRFAEFDGCAVTESGRVRCFALSDAGAAPDAWTEVNGTYPPFVEIVSSGYNNRTQCGLDESGGVWCWGNNDSGLVGDGTTTSASTPQRVELPDPATEVSLWGEIGCALTTAGEVHCWGSGYRNRLEQPTGTGPSRLVTNLRFSTIAVFDVNALCGITPQQVMHCWGRGSPRALWPDGPNGFPPEGHTLSYTGARSLTGQRELTFVTTSDGVGAWWGDIHTLHTPHVFQAYAPQAPKYPLGFTTMILRDESTTICGRNAPTDPAICFRTEMFFSYPLHVVDPTQVIGFGVPGP